MRIVGSWFLFSDGETRPILRTKMRTGHGTTITEQFLIDIGADRTVLSAAVLEQLDLPIDQPPADWQLRGISGSAEYVIVECIIELSRDDGGPATVRGKFAAFRDPFATDLSVLGRHVLNNFDVILSRRNDEVLLLAQRHRYQVVSN
jgi:hypothetical protein